MKSFSKLNFFQEITLITQNLNHYWNSELRSTWPENQTYLKSLLGNQEAYQEFCKLYLRETSLARIGATLAYLDQYDRLQQRFSSFTEFSMALALNLSPQQYRKSKTLRTLCVLCRLDSYVAKALFLSENEWAQENFAILKDIELLIEGLTEIHPRLRTNSALEKNRNLQVA